MSTEEQANYLEHQMEEEEYLDWEDEPREEGRIIYESRFGGSALFINVYSINRCFGGPEEGGWWYDVGEPIKCIPFEGSVLEAREFADKVREEYQFTRKRYSVLGGEDYDVKIETIPAHHWPEVRPHYE